MCSVREGGLMEGSVQSDAHEELPMTALESASILLSSRHAKDRIRYVGNVSEE